jgi:hypothetical protein
MTVSIFELVNYEEERERRRGNHHKTGARLNPAFQSMNWNNVGFTLTENHQ